MVDDVREITETAESKAAEEALDRARLARERREAEQRKRLDELRAHAAAAQAQREKRDEDRRKRQLEQRAKDDDRRQQVEERKRAIWEASISRREALLQRERDRTERLERARASRSSPRPAFAFGSSTPRLLEPIDSAGFFWAARSTNPIDQMNFFESLAASTTNVMFASAPLTRRASALHLDSSDTDTKDEPERAMAVPWSSVARRRTDLVPTLPASRAPGRAYSMTRLDKLPRASPSTHHLARTQPRSGDTTPGSRPGSALSGAVGTPVSAGVVRRPSSAPRRPRPASIAGTGVNTPRGGVDSGQSAATTPGVSRDNTLVGRTPPSAPRRSRPLSLHTDKPVTPVGPGEGKPPLHRKPKPSKEHDKSRGKSLSASPGRTLSPSPAVSKEASVDKEIAVKPTPPTIGDKRPLSAVEVTQKLEALQGHDTITLIANKVNENKENLDLKQTSENSVHPTEKQNGTQKPIETQKEVQKPIETQKDIVKPVETQKEIVKPIEQKVEVKAEKAEEREEKKELFVEKTDENEMTTSAVMRRITTEGEAKAALAERRRRAREQLERQAELDRIRMQQEAEEEARRQREEEERQRREEEEARELASLQRRMEEEKLRKAIEAQQQLEREEAERKLREEAERKARVKEDEDKRKAAEEAEKIRREEAEKEEKERLARKQRVEAIMARTRLRKAEEDKKQQDIAPSQPAPSAPPAADTSSTNIETSATNADVSTASNVTDTSATSSLVTETSATSSIVTEPSSIVTEISAPVVANTTSSTVESAGPGSELATAPAAVAVPLELDNGNAIATGDLLGFTTSQLEERPEPAATVAPQNNGNDTADLLGLSQLHISVDKQDEQTIQKQVTVDNASTNVPTLETNNGNVHLEPANIGHISANFIQTERISNENQTKMAENVPKLLDDDFTTHNGHGTTHNHPLTLQNAI